MKSNMLSQNKIDKVKWAKTIERLEELLIQEESGSDKFIVFGLEAGMKKSRETDRLIAEYLSCGGHRNFLMVKKFKDGVRESAERINQISNSQIALPITDEDWRGLRNNPSVLTQYPVVIITHVRYKDLSTDPRLRTFFEMNRHTLIIDEQLEIPTVTFNEQKYQKIIGCLHWSLHDEFSKLCRGLLDEIVRNRGVVHRLVLSAPLVDKNALKGFEKSLEGHWADVEQKDDVRKFIDLLNVFSLFPSLFNNGSLSAVDHRVKRWKLQNNIILDANAEIDSRYKYAPDMIIEPLPKIMDYSGTTIHLKNFNSSKSNINKTENYFHEIAKAIRNWKSSMSKTLIIVDKDHQDELLEHLKLAGFHDVGIDNDYHGEDIAVAHFGDILGKNHWRDFDQVWVISTPLIPMQLYPLHWSYYAGTDITDQNLEMFGTPGKYSFRDPIFEEIRQGCLVSEIYQAIKRINRDGKKPSRFFLIQSDESVVEGVIKQFPGINIGEPIDLNPQYKEGKKSNKIPRPVQLANLLKELQPGVYKKQDLYNHLGWPSNNKLGRYFKNREVTELEAIGLIKIRTHAVEVFPKAA